MDPTLNPNPKCAARRTDHTLPITALHCGMGEGTALVATASLDRSCKLWSMATGQLLRSVQLPSAINSVTLDAGEHVLYAGGTDGVIYEVPLVDAGAGGLPSVNGPSGTCKV